MDLVTHIPGRLQLSLLRTAAALALLLGGPMGCMTMNETFEGEQPEHVWAALVAVAETPDYRDDDPTERWFVRENEVWTDETNARIEVYRVVDRVLQQPLTQPVRQKRTWRFQIRLQPKDPPKATFVSRGFALPTQAAQEADRYFEDVQDILSGAPIYPDESETTTTVPPPDIEPYDPTRPMIDVDDLEPR